MFSAVTCIAVGQWCQDTADESLTIRTNGSVRNYFLVSGTNGWDKLIEAFSHEGQMVLVLADVDEPGM